MAHIDELQRAAEVRLYAHYGFTTTERWVDVAGTRVRVVETPGTGTPVLLLHGAASVTAAAIPLVPAFNGAPVIAIDWPGHGLSGAIEFGDLRTLAVEIIEAVMADQPRFDIVAHSLGGQFALYFALAHPERVRKLVLLGAPGAAFGELSTGAGFELLATPLIGALVLRLPTSLKQYGRNSARTLGPGAVEPWPSELVEVGWYASRRREFRRSLPSLFKAIVGGGAIRAGIGVSIDEASRLGMPVLLIWGDADVFLPPSGAAAWIDAIPDATLIELPAGHAPWLNKPQESAAAVSGFLAD